MSDQHNQVKDLSPEEKRLLLARLLKEKASQANTEHPLAYGQRALWFIHQLAPESSAYNVAATTRICSPIDIDIFRKVLQRLMHRHAALRTTYEQRDDQLIQVVHAYQEPDFEHFDASDLDDKELYNQITIAHKRPFDLVNGPVVRWQLFTRSPLDHVLIISVHHIAFDGYSSAALQADLKLAYDAEIAGQASPLLPVKATYTDYVAKQLQLLASEEAQRLRSYWVSQLSGELPILNLPTDFPRPLIQTYEGSSVEFAIGPEQTERLLELARAEGVTLYVLLLSIFQTQLHRYSGQNDLLIGTPTSNRDLTEFGSTIGYFIEPVVLRSSIEVGMTFRTLLAQTRKTVIDAIKHQSYPFILLVEELVKTNDPSRSPIFQLLFNLYRVQQTEFISTLLEQDATNPQSLLFEPFLLPQEEGQFDLSLEIMEARGMLWCALKFNTDLFKKPTIERMAGHYQELMNCVLLNPNLPLSELSLLTKAERQQLLVEWNDTRIEDRLTPDQKIPCIHQLFEEQVERNPHAIAIQFEEQTLTYDQLNRRANQLAHYLRRLGVGPDHKVGIYIERSLDMIIGLYAIHKAGGAYVPLDPTYPDDRVAFMLADAQITVLLTQEALLQQLPDSAADSAAPVVCMVRDWPIIEQESTDTPINTTCPENLCYVIYTSGSTGKPKGVMVEHRNVANFFTAMDAKIPHSPGNKWLAVTSTSFDISVLELFWTLTRGFTVILYADSQLQTFASGLADAQDYSIPAQILRHRVTHLQCTPAMAEMLMIGQDSIAAVSSLETMLVGGEALSTQLASTLRQHLRNLLLNMYGPTETTIWSSTYQVDEIEQPIPIGKPIANTTFYILDNTMQPVPIGVPGELYVGGAGVVRGYWNRPELTAERFIADPFSDQPGARLYRTGDLARYHANGNVDFLGRNDFQVKIRGHRIELGEIESELDRHPSIQKSVVVVREDIPGDKKLVAYLILQESKPIPSSDLRLFLRETLPEYMIPAAFVAMDAFPLTPNRKVDRKAFPAPEQQKRSENDLQSIPTKPMEILVADIWREVLNMDSVSIYDNFFDLGGHSLQVMQVVTRLQTETGIQINPIAMRMQTLGQLALACEAELANPTPANPTPVVENKRPKNLLSTFKRLFSGTSN